MRLTLLLALSTTPAWATPSPAAYERAVDLASRLYLYPDDLDPAVMLYAAGAAVADRVDWLVVERHENTVAFRHGNGDPIGEVTVATLAELPASLVAAEELVLTSAYDAGDVDVRLALLEGMTDALDRYSTILAGETLERFDTRLKGTLVGVGAQLALSDGDELVVTSLVPGGPAERGGLLPGDVIVRIEGRSTVNMPVREASRRIRGDEGTAVSITVRRGEAQLELTLQREEIPLQNVDHRILEGNIGYLRITHISQRTVINLKTALSELSDLGGLARGLVIDLRGNSGGSMKEAARSADEFVAEGMLLRTVGPDGGKVQNLQARMDAENSGTEPNIPIAILIDERTASGAEILAGALFELDRAVLVGSRSYGKGTVQKIYTLDPETRFKLTVAQYLVTNDRVIADKGLIPDVTLGEVDLDEYGARFHGWTWERSQTEWADIVPWVREREGWRGQPDGSEDLPLELARQAIDHAAGPSRKAVLDALRSVAERARVEQHGHLVSALEQHGVNWSPAPEGVDGPVHADVGITTRPDSDLQDVLVVTAEVRNTGNVPMARTLVELSCDTFDAWDGVVIPVGFVAPDQSASGTVKVPLGPGVAPRVDQVDLTVRADRMTPATPVAQLMRASSSDEPRLRVMAHLEGEGADRVARVRLRNLANTPIEGVEAYFEHPGDLDLELIDQAARIPVLAARDTAAFDLALVVGPTAPSEIPLHLVVESDRYGTMVEWPLVLPLDGSETELEAPRIAIQHVPATLPVGEAAVPLAATDDRSIRFLVAYLNGEKVAWAEGTRGRAEIRAPLAIEPGRNRLVLVAEDDHGIRSRISMQVHGESAPDVADQGGE